MQKFIHSGKSGGFAVCYLALQVDALVAAKDARIAELEAQVQHTQTALAFWLPSMPRHLKNEQMYERLAHDIDLLIGLATETAPDAEEIGWITLNSELMVGSA